MSKGTKGQKVKRSPIETPAAKTRDNGSPAAHGLVSLSSNEACQSPFLQAKKNPTRVGFFSVSY